MEKNNKTNGDTTVVAATFADTVSASIARGMLEANNIPSELCGGTINSVLAIHLTSVDGVQLIVHACDLPRALELLEAHGDISKS